MSNTNKIAISIGDLMRIANWMETYRDPYNPTQIVTIETTETGIGQGVMAYIETKPGEGVYRDFTDYNNW